MMATSVGSAYITLMPSMDGFASEICSEFSGAGAKAGNQFGDKLSSGVSAGANKSSSVLSKFGSAASTVMAGAAVAGAASIAASAAAAVSQAFTSASDYEQLAGGIKTLFGEDVASTVSANAQEAYKTAGISANDYLEQASSFAASLVSSLGGDQAAAAQYADMAIRDMSDNASTMGTDIESIQNAYQGFAKQNYTMLDNLKLGYGGTKEEMQRLLEDAQAISGVEYNIDSYADIVDAIHVVQSEMGITDNTYRESEHTVSGSIDAMKASWSNFLTALGTGDDVQGHLQTLVDSVGIALNNILPLVGTIFTSVGTVLAENFPTLVGNISTYLSENAPTFLQAAVDFFCQLVTGIGQALPSIIAAIPQIITSIVTTLWNNKEQIAQSAVELIGGLVTGIGSCLGQVGEAALGIVTTIGDEIMALPEKALEWGGDIIQSIADGIWNGISAVGEAVGSVADTIASFLHFSEPDVGPLSNFHTFMPDMMQEITHGIDANIGSVRQRAAMVADALDFRGGVSGSASAGRGTSNTYIINGLSYLPDSSVAQAVDNVFTQVMRTQRMGV
jgi:hypothetical protein